MRLASVNRRSGTPSPGRVHPRPPWIALTLVALAFGVVEAVLVVDLRHLVDPSGRLFPLVQLPEPLHRFELVREVATLVLLGAAASLVRACAAARFATFLFLFGTWDLAYYAALRFLIDWPSGWSDWDLLFLLPTPWLAPVYAPMLIASIMVGVGIATWHVEDRLGCFRVRARHTVAAVLGGAICLATFVFDARARALVALPERYPIEWLLLGVGVATLGYVDAWRFNRRKTSSA